jgi:hypothetical protein
MDLLKEHNLFTNKFLPSQNKDVSLDYYDTDSEELWNTNSVCEYRSKFLDYYKSNKISYELNSLGFRSDEFTSDLGNVFLGCSHTFGVGHMLENTWSYKLSKLLGNKFYNISRPGIGIMTQYRFLKTLLKNQKVENVFHYLPTECFTRYEFFLEDEFSILFNKQEKYKGDLFFELFSKEQQVMFNSAYIDAIHNLCKEAGSNYYLYTRSFYNQEKNISYANKKGSEYDLPARDLQHLLVSEQDSIFESFKDHILTNKDSYYINQSKIL